MELNEFMHEAFPNLELKPPLFYSWDIGIRFELGVNWYENNDYPNNPYILGCYHRAITLFEALHSPKDPIFVVMDVEDYHKGKRIRRELKNFAPYVEKSLLYRIKHQMMPYLFQEEDEDEIYRTHRFSLKCNTDEFKYKPLLKAICNYDLGVKPSLIHRVYFININKETIFHVYDDRGCDVVATTPDSILDIYQKYNNWILDYDRPEIDKVFI